MRIVIYGIGGFAREVAPMAESVSRVQELDAQVVFASDLTHPPINGRTVLTVDELSQDDSIVIAISNHQLRASAANECIARGLNFGSIKSNTSIFYDKNDICTGYIFCNNTIVTSNCSIGKHFHCNLNSFVAHDCIIGDFVTFAPNVSCLGGVKIGDNVYIGTGAMLKPGVCIGQGAIVGMGAVVTRDVPPGATVIGNPARPMAARG